jgi:hypothetical protein
MKKLTELTKLFPRVMIIRRKQEALLFGNPRDDGKLFGPPFDLLFVIRIPPGPLLRFPTTNGNRKKRSKKRGK